jgi:hypothetical protein
MQFKCIACCFHVNIQPCPLISAVILILVLDCSINKRSHTNPSVGLFHKQYVSRVAAANTDPMSLGRPTSILDALGPVVRVSNQFICSGSKFEC